jgi:DNA-directed RNA polymerase specialized sigma24 family protein
MDERESSAAHDAKELDRLVRFMTRKGRRFGLALATYVDEHLASEARAQAISRANAEGRKVATLELGEISDDALAQLAEASQSHDSLFLIGLNPIAYDAQTQAPETLSILNLNLQRDNLPTRVDARVVVWIVDEGYPRLAELAGDLLAVMSTRFRFVGEREIPALTDEPSVVPTPSWMVSTGADVERLEQQAASLAATAANAKDDVMRADAAASAGQLYAMSGSFEEAQRWLREAAEGLERVADESMDLQMALAAAVQWRRLAELLELRASTTEAIDAARRAVDLAERARAAGASVDAQRAWTQALGVVARLTGEGSDEKVDDWELLRRWSTGHGLERLSTGDRDLLERYHGESMTARELAEVFGIPEATVRSRLRRARERLTRLASPTEPSPPQPDPTPDEQPDPE